MAAPLKRDVATRLALADAESRAGAPAVVTSVDDETFTNSVLGASRPGEMSADVMTPGWQIRANAGGRAFVYRASARQVRHLCEDGSVILIYPV
jgi:hypothetical protein